MNITRTLSLEQAAGGGKIPDDLAIAFRVLCNAAKSDRSRMHDLEVEVAKLSHRAENAEALSMELQQQVFQLQGALNQKDSEFKEALSQKDAEFLAQLSQNVQQHQVEVAMLQEQLSQKSFDLVAHQHEIERLQQQLEEAANKARRAEASSAVIRAALASHTRLGQQLSSLLAINRSLNGSGDPESPPDSPSWLTSHFGNPLFADDRWETTAGGGRTPSAGSYTELAEPAPAFCISPTSKQVVPLQAAGYNWMMVSKALSGEPGPELSAAAAPAAEPAAPFAPRQLDRHQNRQQDRQKQEHFFIKAVVPPSPAPAKLAPTPAAPKATRAASSRGKPSTEEALNSKQFKAYSRPHSHYHQQQQQQQQQQVAKAAIGDAISRSSRQTRYQQLLSEKEAARRQQKQQKQLQQQMQQQQRYLQQQQQQQGRQQQQPQPQPQHQQAQQQQQASALLMYKWSRRFTNCSATGSPTKQQQQQQQLAPAARPSATTASEGWSFPGNVYDAGDLISSKVFSPNSSGRVSCASSSGQHAVSGAQDTHPSSRAPPSVGTAAALVEAYVNGAAQQQGNMRQGVRLRNQLFF